MTNIFDGRPSTQPCGPEELGEALSTATGSEPDKAAPLPAKPNGAITTQEFLACVVPWPSVDELGYIGIHWIFHGKKGFYGESCRTVDEAMELVTRLQGGERHIYFCLTRQSLNGGHRDRKHAIAVNALWFDIDIDPGNPDKYSTPEEAIVAVLRFCLQFGIPRPSLIVLSGGGLHVYWLSKRVLTVAEWQPFADAIKAAAKDFGLKFDAGCTGDAARVLRVPGTLNYKYDPPRAVRMLATKYCTGERYDFATVFGKLLTETKTSRPQPQQKTVDQPKIVVADAFKGIPIEPVDIKVEEYPPLQFEPAIKAGCGWLREAYETGGKDFDNPQWHLMILIATWLKDGRELAHKLGDKHPKYTHEETDEKWDEKIRARASNPKIGWPQCKTIEAAGSKHCQSCPHLDVNRSPLNLTVEGVTRADFRAYLPDHSYIFTPTGTFWSMAGVNACLPPVIVGVTQKGKPIIRKTSAWLDKNQPVHHLAWAPGHPILIKNQLIVDGEWIERSGVTTFNLYRPPTLKHGDPSKAGPWLELAHKVYPEDAERLIAKLAHRVQRPQEKINHAVVMGGPPGIGKDTILEPVKRAVGSWNFKETSPQQILGRFNGYLQSVIMRISEVRDLGEFNRYQFYEHTKVYFAAPPNTLRVDEKNIPEHDVMNVTFGILTTNRLTDGIYLQPDDRRHDVLWSKLTKHDFTEEYWIRVWKWYDEGGAGHVAAYLAALDISAFNPKAPPPQTEAFWAIVDANRAPEEGELQDLLDKLSNPNAVTVDQVIKAVSGIEHLDIRNWLLDRKNRRSTPHRFEAVGYVPVRNAVRGTGLWVVGGVRQVVYAKKDLLPRDRLAAVTELQREADKARSKTDGKG